MLLTPLSPRSQQARTKKRRGIIPAVCKIKVVEKKTQALAKRFSFTFIASLPMRSRM